MKKKLNMTFVVTLLIFACISMTACNSSIDKEDAKEPVSSEQADDSVNNEMIIEGDNPDSPADGSDEEEGGADETDVDEYKGIIDEETIEDLN